VQLFDYVFIARPILMYPVWTFFLAGFWGGERFSTGAFFSEQYVLNISIFSATTLVMGSAYIVNQIQDVETDRINNKFFILTQDAISLKTAWIQAGFMVVLGLAIGFFLDISIGFGLVVLFILAGFLYNFPPASFKDRPFGGMLINGIGGYIIYSIGWSLVAGELVLPVQGVSYIFAVMALYIYTTLPDMKGDRKTDKITFGVKFGIETSVIVALVFEIITLLLALYFKDWLLGIPALLILPLFIRSCFKKNISTTIQTTKYSIAFLTAMVCIFYIWYAIIIVFVFVMTKLYYKKRFNFNYPDLRV